MNDEVTTDHLHDLILHYSTDSFTTAIFKDISASSAYFPAFSTILFCLATGTYTIV